jgi:hypothetical protein
MLRLMRRWARRIYAFLCVIVALCLWFAGAEHVVFLALVSAFFFSTALAVFRGGRLGLWLAGISGALLGLYALAVLLIPGFWEDGSGILLALGTGLVGTSGLVIGIGGGLEREDTA